MNRPPHARRWPASLVAGLCLSLLSCGRGVSATSGDPDLGAIDATVLDAKLLPSTDKKLCPAGNCYPGQFAYARGKEIYFYNLGAVATSSVSTLNASSLPAAYVAEGCQPVADDGKGAFPTESQLPVFSALPLATTKTGVVVLPLVRQVGFTGVEELPCNTVKDEASIASADGERAGRYGAQVTTAGDAKLWGVIDGFGATLRPQSATLKTELSRGWYRGLQLGFLDGGRVPVDAEGRLVAMEAVQLVNAAGTLKPTDPQVVILPFLPGEAGYSPMVRLHTFTLPAGKSPGAFTGICPLDRPCEANEVDLTKASATAATTLFIVASPQ